MQKFRESDHVRKFRLIDRLRSFRSAFSGIWVLFKYEHNSRIHLVILILVITAGIILKITLIDWIEIIFASGLVFASECFNTAIEYLGDIISPGYNERIKKAKDVAAAGVFCSALISVIIGIIIFTPKIYRLLFH
jgi:diacylglycerol kinase